MNILIAIITLIISSFEFAAGDNDTFKKFDLSRPEIESGANKNGQFAGTDDDLRLKFHEIGKRKSTIQEAIVSRDKAGLKSFLADTKEINASDRGSNSPLMTAVIFGNTEAIEILAGSGADISQKSRYDETLLGAAIEAGKYDVVKTLIEKGADVNQKTRKRHPLSLAINYNRTEIVRLLLEKGVRLDLATDDKYHPPLFESMERSDANIDIVRALLDYGADPNEKIPNGNTALSIAFQYRHFAIADELIRRGADVQNSGNYGNTPLHMAVINCGDSDSVNMMRKYVTDIDAKNSGEVSAIYYSITYKRPAALKALIDAGADLKQLYTSKKMTLLSVAIDSGNDSAALELIDAGIDVNLPDSYKDTPLHMAAIKGNIEIIKKLISRKADIEARNLYGNTPLFEAVASDSTEAIELLVKSGASLSAKDKCHQTPLIKAAIDGKPKIACFLIDNYPAALDSFTTSETGLLFYIAGEKEDDSSLAKLIRARFDINATDRYGETALHRAVRYTRTDCMKRLVKNGANINAANSNLETPVMIAAETPGPENLGFLIAHGANIRAADKNGNRALHRAATRGYMMNIKALLSAGAEIDCQNNLGATALHIAESSGKPDVIALLKQSGANRDIADKNGITPGKIDDARSEKAFELFDKIFSEARFIKADGVPKKYWINFSLQPKLHKAVILKSPEVVETLIKNGADVNEKNMDGETAIEIAMETGAFEAFDRLYEKSAEVNIRSKIFLNFTIKLMNNDRRDYFVKKILSKYPSIVKSTVTFIDEESHYYEFPMIDYAILTANADLLNKFIAHGADVNEMTGREGTPLYFAFLKSAQIKKKTLPRTPEKKDKDNFPNIFIKLKINAGNSPERENSDNARVIIQILERNGAKFKYSGKSALINLIETAFEARDGDIIFKIFESGVDPNIKLADSSYDISRNFPLCLAVKNDMPDVTKFLIARGARWMTGEKAEASPLNYALGEQAYNIAEMLVATREITIDDTREVPLPIIAKHIVSTIARRTVEEEKVEIGPLLALIRGCINKGHDPLLKGSSGKTALEIIEDWDVGLDMSKNIYGTVDDYKTLTRLYKDLSIIKADILGALRGGR